MIEAGTRAIASKYRLQTPGSQLVNSRGVGEHYGRSRHWGYALLKSWHDEQIAGGQARVIRRGRFYYTTRATLRADAPKGRDEVLMRRLETMERDLSRAFVRIAELERKLGARR